MTISRATTNDRNMAPVAAALERTLFPRLLVRVIKEARLYAYCDKDPLQSHYRGKDVPFVPKFVELRISHLSQNVGRFHSSRSPSHNVTGQASGDQREGQGGGQEAR